MRIFRLAAAAATLSLSLAVSAGAASAQVTPQAVSDWLSGRSLTPELVTEGEESFIRAVQLYLERHDGPGLRQPAIRRRIHQ